MGSACTGTMFGSIVTPGAGAATIFLGGAATAALDAITSASALPQISVRYDMKNRLLSGIPTSSAILYMTLSVIGSLLGGLVAVSRLNRDHLDLLDQNRAKPQTDGMMQPFWKTKTLEELSAPEWESLCDGCGKCCLSKLEDEDTGEIHWTSIGCRLFDASLCRCSDYEHRLARVPDCVGLTPGKVRSITWLPSTCGYRLVAEGRDLYWWHHLVSGSRATIHEAGMSVRGRVTALEDELDDIDDYFDHMLDGEP